MSDESAQRPVGTTDTEGSTGPGDPPEKAPDALTEPSGPLRVIPPVKATGSASVPVVEPAEEPVEESAPGENAGSGEGPAGGSAGERVAREGGTAVATEDRPSTAVAEPAEEVEAADDTENAEDHWARFAPAPERIPGRVGRVVRGTGRVLIHEWTLVCLAATAIAVIMTWPSALHPATTIPADIWDPTLQAWQMAWAGHALTTDPLHLWDANAFYPDSYSYAFSDTLFGYFPAGLIGTGPAAALVRYNIMFILLHALAFIGAYALVRQLGARPIAAAVAGAAFGYAPWRWGQAGHMHVLSIGGIALSLAMLARGHGVSFTRGFRREEVKPGWALAGWCVAAWQISLGFGIGLPFAYVLIAICVVAFARWLLKGLPPLGRRLWLFDLGGAAVFGVVGLFMGLPYLQVIKQHPEAKRGVELLQVFSPDWRAFITAPAQSLPWGTAHEAARATMQAPAETTLLPGFMLYGLAVAGLFFSIWSLRTRLWLLAGTVLSIILAMGTTFYHGDFTYLVLYDYVPFWSSSRTPGRLIIWTTLLLAILAAGAVGALVDRSYEIAAERVPYRPNLLLRLATLLPLLLVLAEGTNWGKLQHPVVPTQPAAFRTVSGPMMVLPSDQLTDENVMIWSTTKFQKMVNGGSGFYPNDQQATRDAVKSFPDAASVQYLRQLGIRSVIVLKAQAQNSDYARAAATDVSIDGLGITRQDDGDTIIYTLG